MTKSEQVTTHAVGDLIVHADSAWANGNSATGIALAVHLHKQGKVTPSHVIHPAAEPCEACTAGSRAQHNFSRPAQMDWSAPCATCGEPADSPQHGRLALS